jgi:hypothetical protein
MSSNSKNTQAVVFAAIANERAYQDRLDCNHKGTPTLMEEIGLLESYALEARTLWATSKDESNAKHALRKIAAVAVRALENHACPERE